MTKTLFTGDQKTQNTSRKMTDCGKGNRRDADSKRDQVRRAGMVRGGGEGIGMGEIPPDWGGVFRILFSGCVQGARSNPNALSLDLPFLVEKALFAPFSVWCGKKAVVTSQKESVEG